MRRKTMLFACALLLSVFARAQWNGYEVKTIGTTPATTLNSGYYALFQNGHKGFAYLSETMLNLWGNNYNLAKNRIASNSPGISAFADLTRNIATNPAPNDRRWYVFKITNNGDGTCTIQCADGTYFPALGRRIPLVSSATPGVFTFHNHGNYFSFEQNGQGLDGDNYQTGYANVSTLASWDYSTPDANSNRAWTLYPVEMARPIPTSHNYLLRHKMTGLYLHLADSYTETSHVDATTLRPVGTPFKFTATVDGGYTLKQAGSTKTLGHATSSWAAWNTSNATSATWKFVEISADGGEYYITSSKGYLGANVGEAREGAYVYTDKGRHAESVWQLVDENTLQVVPADKKVYALYNAYTNGEYSVSGDPGICTDLQAVPQQFVFHANGTDSKGTTLFRMQRAQMTNEFLSWTNNSPTSVTFNGQGSNFLFLNGSNAGYGWNSGTAPQTPYVNFVGYAGGQYTVFGDKKSTSNTGFDGYSRRSANGLLNNAQCARGANYSTTWRLRELPYVYYNLVVTGWNGAEAPTVTYSHPNDQVIAHAPQTNGGGFVVSFDALNSLSAANFTAQEMNGVPGRVELDGNTVKVTYKTDVNVTYIYKYNGVELLRKNMVVNAGADFPDVELVPQNVTYKTIPVGKVYNDVEFVVNCEFLPNWWITPSATYETANWVYLSVGSESNHKYLRYDASHPEYMSFTDSPANTDDYKWAFLVNPFTNEHKIINKAAGAGKILASVSPNGDGNTGGNTFPHFVSESDDLESMGMNRGWDFVTSYTGFFLQRKGENVGLNNRAGKLAFWTGGKDSGSTFYIVPVHDKAPVAAAHLKDSQGNVVESGKTYRLVNRQTGQVIYDGEGKWSEERFARMEGRWDSNNQKWSIIPEGNGFTVKNSGTGKYVTGNYNSSALFYYNSEGWKYYIPVGHLTDGAYTMYFFEADNVDGQKYYYISSSPTLSSTDDSGRTLLVCDNYVVFPFSSGNSTRAQWAIECTSTTQAGVTPVSSISSGSYYRLVSKTNQSVSMSDTGGGIVTGATDKTSYSQIWQLTSYSGGYTLKNLLTGKYIQGAPGASAQWTTGNSTTRFYAKSSTSNGQTEFYFSTSGNASSYDALHSAPHQQNKVVGWQGSSDASKWLLERVDVTSLDLATVYELQSAMSTDFTNQLSNFFTDYACTQLKSNYASMSDDQLRSAMNALPATLREEAVRVKNNKWNNDATWSGMEKDFRIHNYSIYSDPFAWEGKLGYTASNRLTQPTGIKAKSGDLVYILVNSDVTDSDANFFVEQVAGVDRTGTQKRLKKRIQLCGGCLGLRVVHYILLLQL
ncbi:MAG: hypothetical protein IJ605_03400 [Prevotella sp.]|nr:hypothetical protein [Prevotella sp.]